MTKIEAVGNKDKLQEKAAQQNWEGPTKTKGEAKQEAFSSPPTTTYTAAVKNQPQGFSLPPQSRPIDARGPSINPGTESTLNPSLNASKPSSLPSIAQKTETKAELGASSSKSSEKYTGVCVLFSFFSFSSLPVFFPDSGWTMSGEQRSWS